MSLSIVLSQIVTFLENVRTISEVVYQTNQFAGVGQPLFNEPVSQNEKDIALRCINGYRNEPATNALWFKNPGTNVDCPENVLWKTIWKI